ncbi:MAG: sterol desaturase family protein [Planctomycetaceae bacterium]|nr:sterol desaturase family protein [Planctomycetaceae bacterium]
MLNWFENLSFLQFLAILSAANVLMYLCSWGTVFLIQRFATQTLNQHAARVTANDYWLSIAIVVINILVGIPGWWLWKQGIISLVEKPILSTVLDLVLIFLYFDFSMYVLHRLMHIGWLYRYFHSRHHDHVDVNGISLYLMNPLEALGFAGFLILFLAIRPYSFHALMIYLFINWLYGTMGHSGITIRNQVLAWCVGDTEFHHVHHSQLVGNYGFYSGLWDRIFRTHVSSDSRHDSV